MLKENKRNLLTYPSTGEVVIDPDGGVYHNVMTDPALRKRLGLVPYLAGGARGFNTESDVIRQTVDGVDTSSIWTAYQETIRTWNARRTGIVGFLTYGVTNPTEAVPQFGGSVDFEVASEFGVPRSARQGGGFFTLGFPFEWYDLAERYTWKFLAEATSNQIDAIHNAVLEADNRLVFSEVMRTLFRNTNRMADIQGTSYNVYALYNADGTVPPQYGATTFDGTHQHYLVSGAATVDSGDLDDLTLKVTEHGYSRLNGSNVVIIVNKAQGDTIRQYRSIANGGAAMYDFVPAQGTPGLLLPVNMITDQSTARPAATLQGMNVIGAYGEAVIVQEDFMPAGYMVCFATGGSAALTNPLGIREHAQPSLRGLRLAKGRNPDYPLQDAIYGRGFGVGIRQRGGAAVMQIKATGAYVAPTTFV